MYGPCGSPPPGSGRDTASPTSTPSSNISPPSWTAWHSSGADPAEPGVYRRCGRRPGEGPQREKEPGSVTSMTGDACEHAGQRRLSRSVLSVNLNDPATRYGQRHVAQYPRCAAAAEGD